MRTCHRLFILLVVVLLVSQAVRAQTTAFNYQGKLTDSGNLANGNYDIQFALFDGASGGAQQGMTQTINNVAVSNGIFIVQLDFGVCPTCFNGAARFLEIALRPSGSGSFTTLMPRQPITSNPYALRSLNSAAADGLSVTCVSCVTSSQIQSVQGSQVTGNISGSQVSGTIPMANVPAGSTNYIQNTNSQQGSSNFNISGNGLIGGNVGIGTTAPQYKLHVEGGSGVYGNSTNGYGIVGISDSFNGVLGTSTSADGVQGFSTNHYGV